MSLSGSLRLLSVALLVILDSGCASAAGRGGGLISTVDAREEVVLEGTIEVLIEDSDRGSRTLYFLLSGDRRISLRFAADPPNLMTGTRVRVQGRSDADGSVVVRTLERLAGGKSPPA